jgi:hypothetical protein
MNYFLLFIVPTLFIVCGVTLVGLVSYGLGWVLDREDELW